MPESGVTVTGRGFENLGRTFTKASREIGELSDGLGRAAEIITAEARVRAPKRTGRLAGSLGTSKQRARALVTATAAYAGPIHWGWPARGIGAQPFILDAAEVTRPQWENACGADAQHALDRVKGV
jgi:hypothetical protein